MRIHTNLRALIALSLLVAAMPAVASSEPSTIRVGYGEADTTWHVGAGSGQYSAKDPNAVHATEEHDPFNHSWSQRRSYGVQSRLSHRAIVVEGTNGKRVALVKADHYLASDALVRRASQILDDNGTSGIGYEDIMFMASHNHSSPFYYSPSWGPWLFQDLFDVRAFEFDARRLAQAIEQAAASLQPARMGATTIQHKIYKGNIAGPSIGDDGTPVGYPDSHADFDLSILRFDAVPSGEPIAVMANFGQHPESNDDYDLITADFLAPLERMVERDTGAPLVWSQSDVGSGEGPYESSAGGVRFAGNDLLPDGVRRAWAHVGHAQTERGARYLANDIVTAFNAIGAGDARVPFSSDFPVEMLNAAVPPPLSHPYSSVSNCRTETTVERNPGSPILGLPDCQRGLSTDRNDQTWEQLKALGVPLPEHYDAPSWGAVEENQHLRLQVVRLGGLVMGSCSCEAQMDLILNFKSRANDVTGDIFDGYEWPCTQLGDTSWNCKFGRNLESTVNISDAKHERMMAQIHNDAAGWDAAENAVASMGEPLDPRDIKGNFTKEELPASLGYKMVVGVGHAGEYQGYVVSYREYMMRDHYRKALTPYGPHSADYMVTRLVRMAGALKGGPALSAELHQGYAEVDTVRQGAFTRALGAATSAAYDAWVAALPNDLGPVAPLSQPSDITRFDAAEFSWRGGSNAIDNPTVRVERLEGDDWVPFADQSGEVQTQVRFPTGPEGTVATYTSSQEWRWTANFEAFDAFPRAAVPGGQTPSGVYRFVVDGVSRTDGVDSPYRIISDGFSVDPWSGINVTDARREGDGSVSFVVGPITYPRTYSSSFRYIADDGNALVCRTCSFRPWASKGAVEIATVHVVRDGGATEDVPATLSAGRWVAAAALGPNDVASIEVGGVVDTFGEINGSAVVVP